MIRKTYYSIKNLLHKIFDPQFVRFVLVAILNTAFGYFIYAFLLWIFNLINISNPYIYASFFGYVIGIFFNFKTYSALVFKTKNNSLIFKFILVYVVCWLTNILCIGLLEKVHINNYLAGAIVAIPVGFLGYVLNSFFVFKKKPGFLNHKNIEMESTSSMVEGQTDDKHDNNSNEQI